MIDKALSTIRWVAGLVVYFVYLTALFGIGHRLSVLYHGDPIITFALVAVVAYYCSKWLLMKD